MTTNLKFFGQLSIDFFNDSGQPLRFIILAEGWIQDAAEGGNVSPRWSYETSSLLSNGYFSATREGRNEKVGSTTVSDVRRTLPNRTYQKIKLRVVLEWDEGDPNIWISPQSRVFHFDVTEIVEPNAGGDAVNRAP